jgi:hypothetical protein
VTIVGRSSLRSHTYIKCSLIAFQLVCSGYAVQTGPKSENVIVKLVDGTNFGIKDVVESPTDPRSPLKVAAACRESGVRTKFVDLEAVLASAPKKKKLYTNQRVQEAAEKEKDD